MIPASTYHVVVCDNVIIFKGSKAAATKEAKRLAKLGNKVFIGNSPSKKLGDKWSAL